MWRSPAPAGDLASPDPPLRPEGRSASAPSRHELRRALVCLEPLPKGRSRPIDGLEGWRRHAGRLCSRIGSVNALLVEVCRRDQPSFVDTPSFVRSFCREPFVRWFVGSRHNPLGLGRSEPIGGRFPRYCSRFPSLLRRQRCLGKPRPEAADDIFGTHRCWTLVIAVKSSGHLLYFRWGRVMGTALGGAATGV
jgi:hypothetical protein